MPRLIDVLFALLTLAYPLVVYFGLEHVQPWQLTGTLLIIALLRLVLIRQRPSLLSFAIPLLLILLTLYGWLRQSATALRYYPVLMNAVMFTAFAGSLRFPPSAIERFARLREPNLPAHGVLYTRRVTQIWCGFFVLNGAIALWTAVAADWSTWTLYNGLIAYVLMGALLLGEYLLRDYFRSAAQ